MTEAEKDKRRIVDMDRFLVTKRNVLFWSAVLLTVELLHGTDAITPSALGANVAIPPSVLGIGLAAILTYHVISFLIDRRQVLLTNDDTGKSDQARRIEERLEQMLSDVTGISAVTLAGSKNLEAAFRKQQEVSKGLQSSVATSEHTRQQLVSYNLSIEQHNRNIAKGMASPVPQVNLNLPSSNDLEAHLIAHEYAVKDLEKEYRLAQNGVPDLINAFNRYNSKVGKLSKMLDKTDRRLFIFWYTGLTLLFAVLAYASMIVDIASDVPISCKLEFLRSPAKTEGCPTITKKLLPFK
jgi:hypothetical protein